ncbi:MAG: hypothetical protein FGM24_07190 [Candidatus Kapabacteria bacterium]|nr:hypothetical protein [Candidatus Kapabacteria bacterium]
MPRASAQHGCVARHRRSSHVHPASAPSPASAGRSVRAVAARRPWVSACLYDGYRRPSFHPCR